MSVTRHVLRRQFHVDAENIVVATLRQLAVRGEVPASVAAEAAQKYAIEDVMAAPVGESGGETRHVGVGAAVRPHPYQVSSAAAAPAPARPRASR
jgi:hypothetical protein